jgi:hypothetical protein
VTQLPVIGEGAFSGSAAGEPQHQAWGRPGLSGSRCGVFLIARFFLKGGETRVGLFWSCGGFVPSYLVEGLSRGKTLASGQIPGFPQRDLAYITCYTREPHFCGLLKKRSFELVQQVLAKLWYVGGSLGLKASSLGNCRVDGPARPRAALRTGLPLLCFDEWSVCGHQWAPVGRNSCGFCVHQGRGLLFAPCGSALRKAGHLIQQRLLCVGFGLSDLRFAHFGAEGPNRWEANRCLAVLYKPRPASVLAERLPGDSCICLRSLGVLLVRVNRSSSRYILVGGILTGARQRLSTGETSSFA